MYRRACFAVLALSGLFGEVETSDARPVERNPVSLDSAWRALLHYEEAADGSWESAVQSPSYFLSRDGRHRPRAELEASVDALRGARKELSSQTFVCRFPARAHFLRSRLGELENVGDEMRCKDYAAFAKRVDAKSLTIVFASHYLGNPASAFGHTMLYLGDPAKVSPAEYSVSFEADTGGLSAAAYIPLGLSGRLIAKYRSEPLHHRDLKYARREQRDLVFFPLAVDEQELQQLVRVLFERREAEYRYEFFGGNCAQRLLNLIDAAVPERGVMPFHAPAVLPSEVIRHLAKTLGLKEPARTRPSLKRRYRLTKERLSEAERDQLVALINREVEPSQASAAVLSAALLWAELEDPYGAFQQEGRKVSSRLQWRRRLWLERAGREEAHSDELVLRGDALLNAHAPAMLGLDVGNSISGKRAATLHLRWLLHNALDPQEGYPSHSTLEVMRLQLRAELEGLRLDELALVRVERLSNEGDSVFSPAWRFELGGRRVPLGNDYDMQYGGEFVGGLSARLSLSDSSFVSLYALAGARTGYSPALAPRFDLLGSAQAGLIFRLPLSLRVRLHAESAVGVRQSLLNMEGASLNGLQAGAGTRWLVESRIPLGSGLDLAALIGQVADARVAMLGLRAFL